MGDMMRKVFLILSLFFIICVNAYAEEPKYFKNSIGMIFVYIPAGEFISGKPFGDPSFDEDSVSEIPASTVKITEPFYLGAFEVTDGQWKKVMGSYFRSDLNQNHEDYPVTGVKMEDAQNFIAKLNKLEKTYQYRLPTASEWEYAAKGGPQTKNNYIYYSLSELDNNCWYEKNSESKFKKVGSKRPNSLGLYDICGNAAELTTDRFFDMRTNIATVSDPKGPLFAFKAVLKGCSVHSKASLCQRPSINTPAVEEFSDTSRSTGFRVVASIN
jgi:formylglycine-generating enzyme required for sulfatase activity